MIINLEELLQQAKGAGNLWLGDFSEGENLLKGSRDLAVAAGDENAASEDGVYFLPLADFGVFNQFVIMLRRVRNTGRKLETVAEGTNLCVALKKFLIRLVIDVEQFAGGSLEFTVCHSSRADGCLKLRAVQEDIGGSPNARRVYGGRPVAISESSPLGSCINNPGAQHETAAVADHVSR